MRTKSGIQFKAGDVAEIGSVTRAYRRGGPKRVSLTMPDGRFIRNVEETDLDIWELDMSTKTKQEIAELVARAIVDANPLAGCRYDKIGLEQEESAATRASNLLAHHDPYGPYVAPGDPHKWGGPDALATVYMEPIGTDDDCIVPMDYHGNGFSVVEKANDLLAPHGVYIDFINAAVASVYRS